MKRGFWKSPIKFAVIICLLSVLAFGVFVVSFLVIINNGAKPHVYSSSQASKTYAEERSNIAGMIKESFNITVPDDAEDLYFAYQGFGIRYSRFAAFRFRNEMEFEAFCDKNTINMDHFKKGNLQLKGPWSDRLLPSKWKAEYQDTSWQLSAEKDFLYCQIPFVNLDLLIYAGNEHRIYLLWDSGG